mgnify:FL=1
MVWFVLKGMFVFFCMAMVRSIVPRYRYDQLMRLGWKVFLPISLAMVFITAFVLMAFDLMPNPEAKRAAFEQASVFVSRAVTS